MQTSFSQLCMFSICALLLHFIYRLPVSNNIDGVFGERKAQSLARDDNDRPSMTNISQTPLERHDVVSKPNAVILMSLGRSGSSAIFDTMSTLAGKRLRAFEHVGSNPRSTKEFFLENIDGSWLPEYFKGLQMEHPKSKMVGFKWKPYYESMRLPGARAALEAAARENIRVVYSRRNPLDVTISRFKHRNYKTVQAHCWVGDEACVAEHKRRRIQLPVGKSLIAELNQLEIAHREAQNLLQATGVLYMNTTYEQLFFDDDPDTSLEAWVEIMRFIGVTTGSAPASKKLTLGDIRAATSTAYTGVPSHEKFLSNYKNVSEALAGTQYEGLLH